MTTPNDTPSMAELEGRIAALERAQLEDLEAERDMIKARIAELEAQGSN